MRFTLITEGVSENRIIKHILNKFFYQTELYFRDAQPQIVNNKQKNSGGWNEVLKYCERTDDLKEIFNNTDYLVIQIDTDQCQTKPFSISHTKEDNTIKSVEELHKEVTDKLKGLISEDVFHTYGNRIFFAICVHSIECWLLPIHYSNHRRNDIRNCLTTLNHELNKKNLTYIRLRNKNGIESIKAYDEILKNWRRAKDIKDSAQHNFGFISFLETLELIQQ